MKRTIVLLAAVLALVLAACGSNQPDPTATAQPTPEATPTQEPTPEPTEQETAEPSESDAGSGSVITGELDDALPDNVGGLERQETPQGMDALIGSMLQGQGVDADSIDFAYGMYGQGEVFVTAVRIEGMPPAQLALLAQAMSGGGIPGQNADVESEQISLGGKDVLRMNVEGEGADQSGTVFVYQAGDAFFSVVTQDEALAEDLLSRLP